MNTPANATETDRPVGGIGPNAPTFVMTMTWTVQVASGGTRVEIIAEDGPDGISVEDHAVGLASSLANLARFAES